VSTYQTVLFIHLLALFIGIGAGSILVVCLFKLAAATTVSEAAPWGSVAGKTGRVFPIAIVGLFGSGAYLTSDAWTWTTGWIVVGIAGLAVLAVQGPLFGERSGKKLEQALRSNGPGPLGEQARRMARYPALWITEFSALGLVFGIVWNMTLKPGLAGAIAAAVSGYVVGAAVAMLFARSGHEVATVTSTKPTAG
jgi:hypothetical protein